MSQLTPNPDYIRDISSLARKKGNRFALRPEAEELRQIADELDVISIRKLAFEGEIKTEGREDWRLVAQLGASVQQPCVVTLDPVTTRIDTNVTRLFTAQIPDDDSENDENDDFGGTPMADDAIEPLERSIDLKAVMLEALALALPDYPRSENADLGDAVFTEPGKSAMTDEDAKPFAGLASLKDKLAKPE